MPGATVRVEKRRHGTVAIRFRDRYLRNELCKPAKRAVKPAAHARSRKGPTAGGKSKWMKTSYRQRGHRLAKQSPSLMQPVNTHRARARERHEAKRSPIQGNSPHVRPVSRWFSSALVNLRRFLPCRLRCHGSKPEDLSMRFLRHGGIYRSDVGPYFDPSPGWSNGLPSVNSNPNPRTRREDHDLLIVSMSSDRLFLDRVGRHQSPSPLHRHDQISTHFPSAYLKPELSTLLGTGTFYFALTGIVP